MKKFIVAITTSLGDLYLSPVFTCASKEEAIGKAIEAVFNDPTIHGDIHKILCNQV